MQNGQPDGNRNGRDPDKPGLDFRNNRFSLVALAGILLVVIILAINGGTPSGPEITYSDFLQRVENGEVSRVTIVGERLIRGQMRSTTGGFAGFVSYIPYFHPELTDLLIQNNVRVAGEQARRSVLEIILTLSPAIIGILLIWFIVRQMQGTGNRAFSFGRSKARKYDESQRRITFADVAGQEEAKYELQEVVEFLKNPARFQRIGARIPKGVLLVGMPGTGKTLLARAAAGEAGVNFFHMSGSDFVEMFVGVGASRVRDLFDQGRKNSPCILFIDELDAVGRTRGAGYGGGHDEREQTLNQMLVEMDGFDTVEGVIVLAATNRPDVLDPALLRPGRFDRQIVVDMPDVRERESILRLHGGRIPLAADVDVKRIARATPGTSGADLANIVNEAALYAARKGRERVAMADFEEARDKILMGAARASRLISRDEKWKTAVHEAGHALLHYFLPNADPLHKVTVVPRGRALGVAFSLPENDQYTMTRGYLEDRIRIAYGGYIAEKLFFGETSTGTQNDLQQVTDMARRMVTEWGMSEIGPIAFGQEEEPIFLGREIARHKDYSEDTSRNIDSEIRSLLSRCYADAEAIITERKEALQAVAEALVERETLSDDEVRRIVGLPPVGEGSDAETAS